MNRAVLFWIATAAAALNVAGGIYAYMTNEPMHAFAHGAFAVGFVLWARHLKTSVPKPQQVAQPDRVEMLQADLSDLERELQETRERLKFSDELLKNKDRSDGHGD